MSPEQIRENVQAAEPFIAARLQLNMSHGELASRIGMSYVTIQRLENGKSRPHPHTIVKLSRVLGLDPRDMCDRYGIDMPFVPEDVDFDWPATSIQAITQAFEDLKRDIANLQGGVIAALQDLQAPHRG